MVIGTARGWSAGPTIALSVLLAFMFGYALTMLPLLRAGMALRNALGLALAVLMNTVLPARGLFRTVIVLPMVISGVATALVGVLVFDQNNGIAKRCLTSFPISGSLATHNGRIVSSQPE